MKKCCNTSRLYLRKRCTSSLTNRLSAESGTLKEVKNWHSWNPHMPRSSDKFWLINIKQSKKSTNTVSTASKRILMTTSWKITWHCSKAQQWAKHKSWVTNNCCWKQAQTCSSPQTRKNHLLSWWLIASMNWLTRNFFSLLTKTAKCLRFVT